ncbi:aminotransferase class I/II-fold pyridoxal phosphate-dependent enzyme [Rubripirellula reticaptiva]|uniref:8-amino-7-oxononanoate synthase n=1 Tax=Rubripirellula reticaptiva TaxID=2528013 RepID=A0A5C6FEB1_9BACT|nr:8-amino-7-oxononanoate synthase [Rubripirellula reticaptiva]TWU57969.1 8-amino-7-oxononanoate synthase [Rubripirellula reticaptiva]
MSNHFDHFQTQLDALDQTSRRRRLVPRSPVGTTFVEDGRSFINFGSNDYLGLASRELSGIRARACASGSGASSLVCGWTADHQNLADCIAKLESTEAATLFPSGFAACSGVVATLPGPGDLILSDQFNHASLIDGCRLSAADRLVYPHRDMATVESILRQKRNQYERVWIVTDTIFSMDGTVAPLPELCDLCDRFEAIPIVDEAHATGVMGDGGSGMCEALGVKGRVPIRIGTLSKAIGSQGGFVAGPQVVIDYLVNKCRSLIYSTSLAPSAVRSALAGIDAINHEPQHRSRVRQWSSQLRDALSIETSAIESVVPIVPIIIGTDRDTLAAAKSLANAGFYVPAIRPPTVPEGTARLRVSLSASHTEAQIGQLIEHLA